MYVIMFTDREDAGRQLAQKLEHYRGTDAVVLALPRGGVVIGYEVTHALDLPLDIIVVRKIGHPSSPEYAIGAVGVSDSAIFNQTEAAAIDTQWLKREIERERQEARRRDTLYRGGRKAMPIAGKIAIVVDDGIATGLTMRLAVRVIKAHGPAKIVVAVPAAPPESIRDLEGERVDEIIVLEPPELFPGAVAGLYERFEQVEDEEVIRLLKV